MIRQTDVGRLRDVGFDVVLSGRPGHATLTFQGLPSDKDWDELQQAFDEPEGNPFPREES